MEAQYWKDDSWWAENFDSASEDDYTRRMLYNYGHSDEEIEEIINREISHV
jgi:hypothetical protein